MLNELNLPQRWSAPKCLFRPNFSSDRVLLSPSNNENPYSYKTQRGKRKTSYSHSSARPREMLSAPFPYSLGRMCKSIPTVRIQSRPLTPIFQILKSLNETIHEPPLLRPCRYIFPSLNFLGVPFLTSSLILGATMVLKPVSFLIL